MKRLGVAAASLAALAAMGLVVAGVVAPTVDGAPCFYLKRQLAVLAVGAAAAVLAARVQWRRWLSAAPWLFAVWLAAFVASASLQVDGYAAETWMTGWLAAALFVAWIQSRRKTLIRPIHLGIVLMVGLSVCMMTSLVADAACRERLMASMGFAEPSAAVQTENSRVVEQGQLDKAWRSAKWIGAADEGVAVPNPHASGVSSATAVAFGKAFPAGVMALFFGVLMTLSLTCRTMADASGHVFMGVYGWVCLLVPAAVNLLASMKRVPFTGLEVPLVGCGVAASLVALLGFGIACSAARKDLL